MIERFTCTRENLLHQQLSSPDCFLIDEIAVKGFLCDADYELLTEMSGEKGILRRIDLYEVNETDCSCECELRVPEQVAIADNAFEECSKLTTIIGLLANDAKYQFFDYFCENALKISEDFLNRLYRLALKLFWVAPTSEKCLLEEI